MNRAHCAVAGFVIGACACRLMAEPGAVEFVRALAKAIWIFS
jgi:hypothetical protein